MYKPKYVVISSVLVYMVLCYITPACAKSEMSNVWNIDGITLGSSIDNAITHFKKKNMKIKLNKFNITSGNYTSPPIIFGLNAYNGSSPLYSSDSFRISCDHASNGTIVGISHIYRSRYLTLFNNTPYSSLSVEKVLNALEDKYDIPNIRRNDFNTRYYYIWYKQNKVYDFNTLWLSSSGVILMSLYPNNKIFSITKDAGIVLSCEIVTDSHYKSIIKSITTTLTDSIAAYNGIVKLQNIMQNASDSMANKRKR